MATIGPLDWYRKNVGSAVMVPGALVTEAGQCFVTADSYLHDVYGKPYIYAPGALDVWNRSLLDVYGFTKIPAGQPIKTGDFIFYDSRVGSVNGHVSIASRDGTAADFYAYDSNYGGDAFKVNGFPTLHEVHHNDKYNSYVVGYYRLNAGRGADTPAAPIKAKDTIVTIQNTDTWFARCMKTMQHERGRDITRDEFVKLAVGNDFANWFASVQDNPEADIAYNALKTGQAALQQNWPGQISDLQTQLQDVKGDLLKLKQTPAVTKIVNKCDVDLDNMDADKAFWLVRFVAWLKNK